MVARQSKVFSRLLPLQSEKSGKVEGGSNPSVVLRLSFASGSVASDAGCFEDFLSGFEFQLLSICNTGKSDEAERKKQLLHRGANIRPAFSAVKGVYVGEENHSHSRQIAMRAKAASYVLCN